jgi:FAD synthetase
MTIEELVEKYIKKTQQVFLQIKENKSFHEGEGEKVFDHTKRYLEDALYYRDQKRFETALASVAYCEGLFDALKILGMVEFQWPTESE